MTNDSFKKFGDMLSLGEEEARKAGASVITCEHLALGMLRGEDATPVRILRHLHIPVDSITQEMEEHLMLHRDETGEIATVVTIDRDYPLAHSAVR